MKYSLFIGRYQPLHSGHVKLIRTVLNEGKGVCVALRNTGINKENPFSNQERLHMFKCEFPSEFKKGLLEVIVIPDISEVCYGRKVGWGIREIRLDEETENISATEIRSKEKNNEINKSPSKKVLFN